VEERATGDFLGRIGCLNPEGLPAFFGAPSVVYRYPSGP
jgi:hypothetical protein